MPLLGTGTPAAQAVIAAEDAVKATWLAVVQARERALSAEELDQMLEEVRVAGYNALFAHMSANMQVSGVAVGLIAPPGGGPVTGTLVLTPGSIT